MNHLIGSLKVPYIAVMDGITMGGVSSLRPMNFSLSA